MRRIVGILVRCDRCRVEVRVRPQHLQHLPARGWTLRGSKDGQDLCPVHTAQHRRAFPGPARSVDATRSRYQ